MSTLIEQEEGRCDERCYDAKSTDCTCVCGGKNHGAGFEDASGQQPLFEFIDWPKFMRLAAESARRILGGIYEA